jgi:hypothetical protein
MAAAPAREEREVALKPLERCQREGSCVLVCNRGYAGREFARLAVCINLNRLGRPNRALVDYCA